MSDRDPQELNERYIKAKLRLTHLKTPRPTGKGLPPGQHEVPAMVAMPPITPDYPRVPTTKWKLRVYGEVEQPMEWNYDSFLKLPQQEYRIDFHCVTTWSKLGQQFRGVPFAEIAKAVQPKPTVRHVIFECNDGYTTNVVYQELQSQTAFIATLMDGKEIESRYGGPIRAVIPHLYGWKSAKFLKGIRFQERDEPGFWEVRGYHNHAGPWTEERFS